MEEQNTPNMEEQNTPGAVLDPATQAAKDRAVAGAENVKGLEAELKSKMETGDIDLDEIKKKLIKDIFDMFLEMGIDPNNPEEVNSFLMDLEQRDPDLLELFMNAFESLSGVEKGITEGMAGEGELGRQGQGLGPMDGSGPNPGAGIGVEGGVPQGAGMAGAAGVPPELESLMGGAGPAPAPGDRLAAAPNPTMPQSPKKQFGNISGAMGMR